MWMWVWRRLARAEPVPKEVRRSLRPQRIQRPRKMIFSLVLLSLILALSPTVEGAVRVLAAIMVLARSLALMTARRPPSILA